MNPFNPQGDEKGAGGGGGGGAVEILALGDIVVTGEIRARGGSGGGGENTLFLNRVGGGSGGGSGGHVVLQSAAKIDLSGLTSPGLIATGGQGGAGRGDLGGSFNGLNGSQETTPELDACPPGYPTSGPNACRGHIDGAGGDGSPGLIQLHTRNGLDPVDPDVILPAGMTLADVAAPTPLCADDSCRLVPRFQQQSRARSTWIDLGEGGFDPSSALYEFVRFQFGGTDPVTGHVRTSGGQVEMLDPLIGPAALQSAPALPYVSADGYTLVADASALAGGANAFLLDDPQLMTHFLVELSEVGAPANLARFDAVAVTHDAAAGELRFSVDAAGPSLTSFQPAGGVQAAVHPAWFRVATNGVVDALPDSTSVRIQLQATEADASGQPDESAATAFTSNFLDLNFHPGNRDLRFVRFDVLFDLDAQGNGLSAQSPVPSLDFLRVPFRY